MSIWYEYENWTTEEFRNGQHHDKKKTLSWMKKIIDNPVQIKILN